jgi:hypothetical protein
MTRAELRQYVRDLTLTQSHEVSDSLVDIFLQEGYFKLVTRHHWSWLHQDPHEFVPGTGVFDLEAFPVHPVIAIYDLAPSVGSNLPLTQITRSESTFFLRTRPIGRAARFYFVEGQNLYFDPEPNDDEAFVCSYYADDGWDAGPDVVPGRVPEAFHTSILANYAIGRVWERQEDLDKADAYLGRFEMGIIDMTTQENTVNEDRPKVFGELVGSRGRARNMPWLDGV